jgi:hypothetical protein
MTCLFCVCGSPAPEVSRESAARRELPWRKSRRSNPYCCRRPGSKEDDIFQLSKRTLTAANARPNLDPPVVSAAGWQQLDGERSRLLRGNQASSPEGFECDDARLVVLLLRSAAGSGALIGRLCVHPARVSGGMGTKWCTRLPAS